MPAGNTGGIQSANQFQNFHKLLLLLAVVGRCDAQFRACASMYMQSTNWLCARLLQSLDNPRSITPALSQKGILTPNLFVLTLPDAARDPFVERSREIFSNLALMLPPVSPLTLIWFRPSFFAVFALPPTRITLVVPPLVTRRARLPPVAPTDELPSIAIGVALPFLTPPLTDTGVFLLMTTPFWPLGVEAASFFPALGLDFGAGFTPLDGVFFFWDGVVVVVVGSE